MSQEWNNSALTDLQRCGEMFRRRHIEGERRPRTLPQARGTAVHAAAREANLRRMDAAVMSVEEAEDVAADAFEREVQDGITPSGDAVDGEARPDDVDAAKDFAVDLGGLYAKVVAPTLDVVAVERKVIVRPRDSDLVVHGTMDVITREPASVSLVGQLRASLGLEEQETVEVIRDAKTSEKSPAASAAERSQQLTMYGMIRSAETGALPGKYVLDYLVRTPGRGLRRHVPLETTRDARDVAALVRRINVAVAAVKRGVFVPADPALSWWCAPRWCEFWSDCPFVNGRRGGGTD